MVLLAPACSSFDQFENYEHRGRVFKELVKQLDVAPSLRRTAHWKLEAGSMAKRVGVDKWLFGTVLLLVLFGLVMVFSASAVDGQGDAWLALCVRAEAGVVGRAGLVAHDPADAGGLRRYNNPRVVFPAVARHDRCCCWACFYARLARHPPLDSVWRHLYAFSRRKSPSRCWSCFLPGFCRRACDQMEDWRWHPAARRPCLPWCSSPSF